MKEGLAVVVFDGGVAFELGVAEREKSEGRSTAGRRNHMLSQRVSKSGGIVQLSLACRLREGKGASKKDRIQIQVKSTSYSDWDQNPQSIAKRGRRVHVEKCMSGRSL